ncbi:DUF1338 domain-containing protein [Salipiger pallidus]|uniref:2-oxoadipate dioxygenase/decarboxylase n=1 Tax=Salipiger pallidus TaxID=1775170 RepID=A0A8J3EIG8_9RHOB|nr:VOC family protein [Salipiger pallidus]GGG85718.1 DUF1338 domain-containing protein [Salipiger pallidus]
MAPEHANPHQIRALFSRAMSAMYREEVPAYGTLMELVRDVNSEVLSAAPEERARLEELGELERIDEERHGAIRLGTPRELFTMRRLFAVMGMHPVGYYDLSVAGVPVHSTAFRPLDEAALRRNPFRVFTSLLRLDLLDDAELRAAAAEVLDTREIYTTGCLELIEKAEAEGGLNEADAERFVAEAIETFRWHAEANVPHALYQRLHDAHRLVADVVAFKGPHINHLTPRTLDIDRVQEMMPERGIAPKAVVEGPPTRTVPILLRQTSFKALEEPVSFPASPTDGETATTGRHTARFGEIEQRGIALTPAGQGLYDRLLADTRSRITPAADGSNADAYRAMLAEVFTAFPDDLETLRKDGLGYFRYSATGKPCSDPSRGVDALIADGCLRADPIVYEDFLPVSAAGIFQSNLGDGAAQAFVANPNRTRFEEDLGAPVHDLFRHYAETEARSLAEARIALSRTPQKA